MAKFIKSSGEVSDVFPGNGRTFTLRELQTLVGGYVEVVRTKLHNVWLIANEEGAIAEPPLPENAVATSMYVEAGGIPDWAIRGDVLVGTKLELDGEE